MSSLGSSQESQDRLDIQNIESTILDIVNNDLYNDQTDKRKLIRKLHTILASNRGIFQNKIKLLDHIIQKLIIYCISEKTIFEDNKKEESFDDIIISFISIYLAKDRNLFIDSLIDSINNLYSPERISHPSKFILLPNAEGKENKIECETEFYAFFFLSLLYKISIRFYYDNPSLIQLFQLLLNNTDDKVQLITLKIMSEVSSISINFSYRIIRLLFWFIIFHSKELDKEKVDQLFIIIFENAINSFIPCLKALVGREIFSYLPHLEPIADWKFMDSVLNFIDIFIKADYANIQICTSYFINIFNCYYINDKFISICQYLALENHSFKENLWSKYSKRSIFIPALLKVCSDYPFDLEILERVEPPLLYDILNQKKLEQIPEKIELALRNYLVEIPPEEKHVKYLINYIPEMPLKNYSPEIIALILQEDEQRIYQNYDQLKKVAFESKSIKLISFLAVNSPDDFDSYVQILSSFSNDILAWEDENYRRSIAKIFLLEKKQIKKNNQFFKQLLENSKLKMMYYIGQEKPLWKLFLWVILHEFTGKEKYPAEAAITILLRLDNFNELFSTHSYYFFKQILVLLDDESTLYRFRDLMKSLFPYANLETFNGHIVSVLIHKEDLKGLRNYYKLCYENKFSDNPPNQEELITNGVSEMITNNIADIFSYLFIYCKRSDTKKGVNFLKRFANVTKILKKCIGNLAPRLLLFIGSDDKKLSDNAKTGIEMVEFFIGRKKQTATETIKHFWEENFLATIIDFCKILTDKKSFLHRNVLKCLITSIQWIEPSLHNCYPRILSISEIGMRISSVRDLVIEFWTQMLNSITNKSLFPKIFGPVISQLLPYFDEFPDQITQVLNILIIDNFDSTKSNLIDIAHLPIFHNKPQLVGIQDFIQKNTSEIGSWVEIVTKLVDQLDTTSPQFRRLILQQLFFTLKSNPGNLKALTSNEISKLVRKIWIVSLHEKNNKHILYCAKCMALLPFDKETTPPEQNIEIEINNTDLIVNIITNFLIKVLEDTSNYSNHDHAAYTIQELLKVLSRSEKAADLPKKEEIWNKFPVEVQDIIYPFSKSRYASNPDNNISPELILNEKEGLKVNDWLVNFTKFLLINNKSDKLQGLNHCIHTLPNSPSLCKFLLPYLVYHNLSQKSFAIYRLTLRNQWEQLLKMLNDHSSNNPHRKEFAKQALLILFSLFDTLTSKSISPSEEQNIPKWTHLGIASDEQISEAALKCELYYRALQHIEFKIHNIRNAKILENPNGDDENDPLEENKEILLQIFEHVDNPAAVEFLKRNSHFNKNSFDDSLIGLEIKSLAPRTDPTKKLDLIKEMISKGRYERALSDAFELKSLIPSNIEIDAMIAKSSLRLQRWEKIGQLIFPIDIDSISPGNRQDAIDIITSRLIYFKKNNDINNFQHDLKLFNRLIILMFQSAEMISYFQMVPLFVQIRLIEEIEEFIKPSDEKQDINFFTHWENSFPMKPEDIERIVSVRSALICAFVSEPVASIKITSQWLQLARFCRKSNILQNSQVFCSRANSYAKTPLSQLYCSLEMAKIYFALNHTNAATSLLRQITPKTLDNKELFAKIKYIDGNWAKSLSSSDSQTIINTYSQSLDIYKTSKAHLALAILADNCVMSLVNNLEQIRKESFQDQTKPIKITPSVFPNKNIKQPPPQQPQPPPPPLNTVAISIEVRKNALFWTGSGRNKEIPNYLLEFLPLALLNYMQAMIMTPEDYYEIVPRILVLMFDIGHYMIKSPVVNSEIFKMLSSNSKAKIFAKMKETIETNIDKVKSSIWANSITQLISRIDQPSELFEILCNFILPALSDYPQAVFWHLMSVKRTKNRQEHFAAIWNRFEKNMNESNVKLKYITDLQIKYDTVTDQLIKLIQYKPSEKVSMLTCSQITPNLISAVKNSEMAVPLTTTLNIPSSETPENYVKNVQKIYEISDKIKVIRSQQYPKKLTVRSNKHIEHHYLIKEDNDLRKDMRMMEFGSFINRLLNRDKRSKQRALSILTYAVICLDQKYGMIEWAENSTTLGEIVSKIWDSQDKLKIIRPKELEFSQMSASSNIGRNDKFNFFVQQLLPISPPVMHIWFAKHFKNLSKWYQARLAFTNSVAIWSMIGFIVGLGDRHPENILVNYEIGFCFHVDFAVLFDKGKSLTHPEIVPFRMTRNIVYGMGVLGTNGDFSAISSLILEILRENKQKILSVLQTFVHDPLIEWQLGVNQVGSNKNPNSNNLAVWQGKMTLKEVESRLSGIIGDKFTTKSPECVVQELIQQATSVENLASMFFGWRPIL